VPLTHCDFSSLSTAPYCDDCTNADVFADIYYTGDNGGLGQQLYDEFVDACDDIKEIEGVANTFDPCPTISVTAVDMTDSEDHDDDGGGAVGGGGSGGGGGDDDGKTSGDEQVDDESEDEGDRTVPVGIIDEETSKAEEDDKIAGGAIFGMIFAALVILALLALLLRRRRNKTNEEEEMLKNLSNEEEVGDRTLMLDDHSRDADSRFGMYPEGRMEGMVLGERALNQDVHKCSSATCELCERQNNVQFLPTRARSSRARMDLADSNRKYGSEDTVNL